ncbi:MAG: hypothetical protein ACKO96_16530, partial [Flammeovirgaceae bacterium]
LICKHLVPLRQTTPLVLGMYLGQVSTPSPGIENVASGEIAIDFSTVGTNYKGRIRYNNTTNTLSCFFHQLFCYGLIGSDRLNDD